MKGTAVKKLFILILLLSSHGFAQAAEPAWQFTFADESLWSRLTYAGTLLAASERQLAHIDPATGAALWVRNDLSKLAQFNVNDVADTPFLVVSERLGNLPPKSRLQVLNLSSGETIWDMGEHAGGGLGAYPVPRNDLLVYVVEMHGKKPGSYVIGFNIGTGEELWRTKIGPVGTLPVHPSDIEGFIRTRDLNGHPPPLVVDDMLILAVGDLYAFDLASGEQRWRFKAKASVPNLKNTYAQPISANGVLYAVSRNSIHALDPATGSEKWKAKIGKAAMPELQLVGDKIVGRLGGTFSDGKNLVGSKPFGAFVVDTASGRLVWKWTKAKDSVTNLRVLPEQGLVMLADKKNLYALDLNASKKGKVVYKEKLEFKRKMGSAELAAKGIGAVGGFLGGGLAGGFKGLGGGGDRGDPPLDIEVYGEQLIIRAQYHVLAHNLGSRRTDWSIEFAPPGMSPFALIAMGAVTAVVVAERAGPTRASGGGFTSQRMLDTTLNISNSFQAAVAARYAAAEKARNLAFFLTKEEEDGMVLMGIDLSSGSEIGRIPMTEKEPQFMVDALGSRVYYFRNKKELLAYDF